MFARLFAHLQLRRSTAFLLERSDDHLLADIGLTRDELEAMHLGLGLTEAQVIRLRDEHGIYMVGDSRINIAGLNARTVPVLAAAIAGVL